MGSFRCPRCRGDKLVKSGKVWISQKKVQQYRCNSCGYRTLYPLGIDRKRKRGKGGKR